MRSFPLIAAALLLSGASVPPARPAPAPTRLVACGWGNLSIFEVRPGEAEPLRETWFWKPQDYAGAPENVDDLYRHIDECKPFDDGERILITASTDGVGIVDRRNRRLIHIGVAQNAHSADILPGGRIVVAGSHGGDSLTVFEGKAGGRALVRKPLPGGHGVHWDASAHRLYALSDDTIEIFELTDWASAEPDLRHIRSIQLPARGGHELARIAGGSQFIVTTADKAWRFDSREDRLAPDPVLAEQSHIKAVTRHAGTAALAWLQADPGVWWSYTLRFAAPGLPASVPVSKRYYKVRWIDQATPRWPADASPAP